MEKQNKQRIPIWIDPALLERVAVEYSKYNCKSQSAFICRAVDFYLSYLKAEDGLTAYAPILSGIVHGAINNSESNLSRTLFKLAVEQAKVSNLLAVMNELDDDTLRKLHVKCVDEVRRINGVLRYESAVRYQQG